MLGKMILTDEEGEKAKYSKVDEEGFAEPERGELVVMIDKALDSHRANGLARFDEFGSRGPWYKSVASHVVGYIQSHNCEWVAGRCWLGDLDPRREDVKNYVLARLDGNLAQNALAEEA